MIAPGRHDASKTMSIPTAPKAKAAPFFNETAGPATGARRGATRGLVARQPLAAASGTRSA